MVEVAQDFTVQKRVVSQQTISILTLGASLHLNNRVPMTNEMIPIEDSRTTLELIV